MKLVNTVFNATVQQTRERLRSTGEDVDHVVIEANGENANGERYEAVKIYKAR